MSPSCLLRRLDDVAPIDIEIDKKSTKYSGIYTLYRRFQLPRILIPTIPHVSFDLEARPRRVGETRENLNDERRSLSV